jgi:hypothetical protein
VTDAAYLAVLGAGAEEREIGVARFSAAAEAKDCELAVTVSDESQRHRGVDTNDRGRRAIFPIANPSGLP